MYAYVHAYVRMHIDVYARIYAYMHAYVRICTHMCVYARICAYMHAYTRICAHMRVYACICVYMHAYMHVYACIYGICAHLRVYARICAYMHAYARICTHMRVFSRICPENARKGEPCRFIARSDAQLKRHVMFHHSKTYSLVEAAAPSADVAASDVAVPFAGVFGCDPIARTKKKRKRPSSGEESVNEQQSPPLTIGYFVE